MTTVVNSELSQAFLTVITAACKVRHQPNDILKLLRNQQAFTHVYLDRVKLLHNVVALISSNSASLIKMAFRGFHHYSISLGLVYCTHIIRLL